MEKQLKQKIMQFFKAKSKHSPRENSEQRSLIQNANLEGYKMGISVSIYISYRLYLDNNI